MPTSLNMKLISFNKAFEIENIIAVIPGFFHHMSKLDQSKWDLSSLTWLNLKYIYIYIYGLGFFGHIKRRVNSILWKSGSGWLAGLQFFNNTWTFHFESFFVLFFHFFFFFCHFYLFNFLYRIVIVIKDIVLYWHVFIEY